MLAVQILHPAAAHDREDGEEVKNTCYAALRITAKEVFFYVYKKALFWKREKKCIFGFL